jgi:3-methylfumaryl-CoA hydratase
MAEPTVDATTIDPATMPDWVGNWVPVTESTTTAVAASPVSGLADLLDVPDAEILTATGTPLPLLWHWAALSEWSPAHLLRRDGHPRPSGFMPPMPHPRRMWLGTSVQVTAAPIIGETVVVDRRVSELVEKHGRQGPFALLTVATTVRAPDQSLMLAEQTQFAYRGGSTSGAAVDLVEAGDHGPPMSQNAAWDWRFTPSAVTLMTFSAATANTHRIHYDLPYAQRVEGYPNLLVHGPLMAVVLAEVVRRELPDAAPRSFTCRATRPMFLGTAAHVMQLPATTDDGRGVSVALVDVAGDPASPFMRADVGCRQEDGGVT